MYRFGFFGSLSDNSLSTNRTLNISNLNYENLEKKVYQNSKDFIKLLKYCQNNEYTVFRLGNSFVPYLSHKLFDLSWLDKLAPIFDETKEKIKDFDIRITLEPGPYTTLNSTREELVQNSLRELENYFWLLDRLGINENGVVLLQGGLAYGNKQKAMERLIETIKENSWLEERLALENDEKVFNAKDILTICENTNIPMVFDIYHHSLNLSEFYGKDIIKTWKNRRVKMQLSSKGEGKFGSHADFVKVKDFFKFENIFYEYIEDIDIMIKAKKRELAIKKLQDDIKKFR